MDSASQQTSTTCYISVKKVNRDTPKQIERAGPRRSWIAEQLDLQQIVNEPSETEAAEAEMLRRLMARQQHQQTQQQPPAASSGDDRQEQAELRTADSRAVEEVHEGREAEEAHEEQEREVAEEPAVREESAASAAPTPLPSESLPLAEGPVDALVNDEAVEVTEHEKPLTMPSGQPITGSDEEMPETIHRPSAVDFFDETRWTMAESPVPVPERVESSASETSYDSEIDIAVPDLDSPLMAVRSYR